MKAFELPNGVIFVIKTFNQRPRLVLELTFKVVMGSSIEKVSFLALSKIGFGSTLGYYFSDSGHFWVPNKNRVFFKGFCIFGYSK